MRKVLPSAFFARPAPIVARALIGKFLVVRRGTRERAAMITETEAYHGKHDKASHAHRGRTRRNAVMFGPAGVWYVYLVYGLHEILNITTGRDDIPSAVLIRGLEGASGPGVLTRHYGITRSLNGLRAGQKSGVWIEDRGIERARIVRTPRIGVSYAGAWADRAWRFVLKK